MPLQSMPRPRTGAAQVAAGKPSRPHRYPLIHFWGALFAWKKSDIHRFLIKIHFSQGQNGSSPWLYLSFSSWPLSISFLCSSGASPSPSPCRVSPSHLPVGRGWLGHGKGKAGLWESPVSPAMEGRVKPLPVTLGSLASSKRPVHRAPLMGKGHPRLGE